MFSAERIEQLHRSAGIGLGVQEHINIGTRYAGVCISAVRNAQKLFLRVLGCDNRPARKVFVLPRDIIIQPAHEIDICLLVGLGDRIFALERGGGYRREQRHLPARVCGEKIGVFGCRIDNGGNGSIRVFGVRSKAVYPVFVNARRNAGMIVPCVCDKVARNHCHAAGAVVLRAELGMRSGDKSVFCSRDKILYHVYTSCFFLYFTTEKQRCKHSFGKRY